jgi:hypothetical protein
MTSRTPKFAALIAAASVVIGPIAVLAGSQTAAAGPRDDANLALPASLTAQSGTTLADVKAKADQAIKNRLSAIAALEGAISAAPADCGSNGALTNELKNDATALTALDATIQADTTLAKAVADSRTIGPDYRIYWLETPKTRIVVACDNITRVVAVVITTLQKIEAAETAFKGKGLDTSAADPGINDIKAQLAAAQKEATQADTTVMALVPDKGSTSVLQSNIAALQAARQLLHSARDHLRNARKDAHDIIADFHALVPHPTTTTT